MDNRFIGKKIVKKKHIKKVIYFMFLVNFFVLIGSIFYFVKVKQKISNRDNYIQIESKISNIDIKEEKIKGSKLKTYKLVGKFGYQIKNKKYISNAVIKKGISKKEEAKQLKDRFIYKKLFYIYYNKNENGKILYNLDEYDDSLLIIPILILFFTFVANVYWIIKIKKGQFYLFQRGGKRVFIDSDEANRVLDEIEKS